MDNKLEVWRVAHEFALEVYKTADRLPRYEMYNLTSQMKRSATSVPTNIIEGQARQYPREFRQFLFISKASNAETKYPLFLATELGYIPEEQYLSLAEKSDRISMMLYKLIKSLKI